MKKKLLTAGLFIFCVTNSTWAIPPSSIALTYDPEQKNLHIEIAHVGHDPRRHYIRKIEVYLNDEKLKDLYFSSQTTPSMATADVPLTANPQDTIRVKAICNQAGFKEETLVIPEEDKESQDGKTPEIQKESKDKEK